MDLAFMLAMLEEKDTSQAFEALKKLEQLSDNSDILYPYINRWIDMVSSERYVVRVRGFRLCCKQAKWDTGNIINQNIEKILTILKDDKPTAVRQALAALPEIVLFKKELREMIKCKVLSIDDRRYKDTMQGLIAKDIQNLLNTMEEEEHMQAK